jgi:hypothetical protein
MFRSIRFLYAIIVMVMIYLQINLKLKFLFISSVTTSIVEHGCVVAACDTLGPELRRALIERSMPELFAFPVETKQWNLSTDAALRGYVRKLAGLDFERTPAVRDPSSVRDFSSIFWLQGNPEFSYNHLCSFLHLIYK